MGHNFFFACLIVVKGWFSDTFCNWCSYWLARTDIRAKIPSCTCYAAFNSFGPIHEATKPWQFLLSPLAVLFPQVTWCVFSTSLDSPRITQHLQGSGRHRCLTIWRRHRAELLLGGSNFWCTIRWICTAGKIKSCNLGQTKKSWWLSKIGTKVIRGSVCCCCCYRRQKLLEK